MAYIVLIVYLALALAVQFLAGPFPASLFAFPLNLILLILWLALLVFGWKGMRKSAFVRFMLSPGATFFAVGLFLAVALAIGITGFRWITGTWPFVAFMLYFQSVLVFIILRGWRAPTATGARLGAIRWRFLFLHVGLLTAVASAFWGAPDTETLRTQAYRQTPVTEAYTEDGRMEWLGYEMILEDFSVSYGTDGIPSDYEAVVRIDGEDAVLKVNHPHSVRFGEDVYLSGYDTRSQEYCVLQIVKEPSRYGTIAGIVMMLAGAFLLFAGGPRRRRNELD